MKKNDFYLTTNYLLLRDVFKKHFAKLICDLSIKEPTRIFLFFLEQFFLQFVIQ